VRFRGVTKRYGGFTAVERLNLEVHRGQVCCLLGHNGAGKTTSLNVLTGKESPSEGAVLLSPPGLPPLDVSTDSQQAQALMGVCSQQDTLFESMTVEEHIHLFLRLKEQPSLGQSPGQSVAHRTEELLKVVQLQSHRAVQSQHLSGGLRRRLSIALALISPFEGSVVVLDEPTTGLDAMVRDQIWQLIRSLKRTRCVVMTTQHLQEAEELADQVALLDQGKLVARGSVDEIKKRFGIGYQLRLARPPDAECEALVLGGVRGAFKEQGEGRFVLPFASVGEVGGLLGRLERRGVEFAVSQASLEEAFLNFTNLGSQPSQRGQGQVDSEALTGESPALAREAGESASGWSLFGLQVRAVLLKRWLSFKRDWRMWLLLLLPSLLIAGFLALGFKREYHSRLSFTYTQQLAGLDGSVMNMDPQQMSGAIGNLSALTQHGQAMGSLNFTKLGDKYLSGLLENPTLENFLKSLASFTQDDLEEDPELKELQEIIRTVAKEDLQLATPYDYLALGLKLMTAQNKAEGDAELQALVAKVQRRVQAYYTRKMQPIMREMVREQAELVLIEGVRYMKEVIYLVWLVFSLALCSGIAVEHPVAER